MQKLKARVSGKGDILLKEYYKLNDINVWRKKEGAPEDSLLAISNKMNLLLEERKPYNEKAFAVEKEFYKKFPNSFITVYNLKSSTNSLSYSELSEYYNRMATSVKESQIGRDLKN